ncbi:hypothetical protein BDY21DRAFT_316907 [Lineolata rhizophorae]|uniref:RRM domain-containing protein n=1 Tax=Lineolata rhizophorae TaxID=578093 RepID=A0A6A6P8F5_9PEZI|nr:hypothetical protein BDY21DRAFT_316907 [Lineolata rhizophorae]
MFLLRRSASLAFSWSPVRAGSSAPRCINTWARPLSRPSSRLASLTLQRRFASDEATSSIKKTQEDATLAIDETASRTLAAEPAAPVATSVNEPVEPAEPSPTTATAEAESSKQAEYAAAQATEPSADAGPSVNTASGAVSSTTLYVGNLFFEVREEMLERVFSEYGSIKKARIVFDDRGLSKGFGFVEFEKNEDAANAVQALNQTVLEGRRMAVQFHRQRRVQTNSPRQPNPPSKTLFIGNMSFEMSDKDLNDLFREIRNVLDVRVAIDRRTGQPRGFAHADFIDVESAGKAKEILQDKIIYGRQLRVDYSKNGSPGRTSPPTLN